MEDEKKDVVTAEDENPESVVEVGDAGSGSGPEPGPEPATAGAPDPTGPVQGDKDPPEPDPTGPVTDAANPPVVPEDPVKPTPSEAFSMGKQYFAGAEWDLAVMREANAIRGNSERFKAVRALPGGSNIR